MCQNYCAYLNSQSCTGFQTYHQIFSIVVQVLVASECIYLVLYVSSPILYVVVLTMRVYALYEHDPRVLSVMLIVGLGGIAVAFVCSSLPVYFATVVRLTLCAQWSFFNGSRSRQTLESLDLSTWNGCINIVQSDA